MCIRDSINTMSHLREGIGLRSYAQENPLRAYTNEGFELYDELLNTIDQETTMFLLKSEIRQNIERKQVVKGKAVTDNNKTKKATPKRVNKIGRNDPCPVSYTHLDVYKRQILFNLKSMTKILLN